MQGTHTQIAGDVIATRNPDTQTTKYPAKYPTKYPTKYTRHMRRSVRTSALKWNLTYARADTLARAGTQSKRMLAHARNRVGANARSHTVPSAVASCLLNAATKVLWAAKAQKQSSQQGNRRLHQD
eukprot:4409129-Pleurochrysis_carterae.AAC.1